MDRSLQILSICLLMKSVFIPIQAQTSCSGYTFSSNRLFASCNDLLLDSAFHWNFDSSNSTLTLAHRFGGVSTANRRWIATAINPSSSNTPMIGSQALVAQLGADGTATAYTSQITSKTSSFSQGNLTFRVLSVSAEFDSSRSELIIFGALQLTGLGTTITHVWQVGPLSGTTPASHSLSGDNVKSFGTLDLLSGATTTSSGTSRKKNVHGVLNAVSWGVLMPMGAIIARYMRVFKSADPAWFYIHLSCQCVAYGIGVAGWGTGLKLGSESEGVKYTTHRNIGISLFSLATLQVFALFLRPKKDHKYRIYWNVYHHAVGYTVIVLSVVNVFKGLDILDPEKKWKRTYIGIIISLGALALILEALTWGVVVKRKSQSQKAPTSSGV